MRRRAVAVVAPAPGEPLLDGVAQVVEVHARPAIHRAQQRHRVVAGGPPAPLRDQVEARLHLPARDGVERLRQPVVEAVAHQGAVEPRGLLLAVRVGRQVLRKGLRERRDPERGGPRLDRTVSSGDAVQQFPRPPPRVIGRHRVSPADDDAPVAGSAAAAPGAVVDDEGLGPGGVDLDSESGDLVVPRDPGPRLGHQGLDPPPGQSHFDLGDALTSGARHVPQDGGG